MERGQIVNLFLEKNMTINPLGLDYFYQNPEKIEFFFKTVEQFKEKPTTIDIDFIKRVINTQTGIEEVKHRIFDKRKFSVDDVSKTLSERYEKIRKYFSNRIELVNTISINRITQNTTGFSLVVMVREKDENNKTLTVEDLTGETTIHADASSLSSVVSDEIIGVVCEKIGDKIKALNVLWPDIPLKREIPKTEENIYCMFLSDLHLEQDFEEKTDKIIKEIQSLNYEQFYIFLFGENFANKKTLGDFVRKMSSNSKIVIIQNNSQTFEGEDILYFSSPAFLNIHKKINLLLCDSKHFSSYKEIWHDKKPEEIMLELLKKRHLDPIFEFEKVSLENSFIIDIVPDIFVSGNFGTSGIKNHKGTTIISCGNFLSEPVYWIVNLATRESIKINLV
jgi:DNA polymerase II small subunit/DNA polymerase delta subunit B